MKMAIFVFFLSIFIVSTALAQTPVFVGEKEAYTANTGIARLGSSAAPLYNPAGLAGALTSKISASGTLFQRYEQEISGAYSGNVQNFQAIPTEVSTIWKWKDSWIGFSIFSVSQSNFGLTFSIPFPSFGSVPTRIKVEQSSLVIGPSYARQISAKWRVGVALLALKRDDFSNFIIRLSGMIDGNQAELLAQEESTTSTLVSYANLGASYAYSKRIQLGARVATPSVRLAGSRSKFTQQVGYAVVAGAPVDLGSGPTEISEKPMYKTQPQIAAGARVEVTPVLAILADAGYDFKVTFKAAPSDTEDYRLDGSTFFSTGMEYRRGKSTWSAGALFRQNPERWDVPMAKEMYGVTMGWLTTAAQVDTGLGGFYAMGTKDGDTTDSKSRAFGLLLNTSYKFQ